MTEHRSTNPAVRASAKCLTANARVLNTAAVPPSMSRILEYVEYALKRDLDGIIPLVIESTDRAC